MERLRLFLATGLIGLYLRFVFATSRWTIEDAETLAGLKGPAIVVFWHARLAAMPHLFRHCRPSRMLVSAHRDGELITRVIETFGFSAIRGSTARQKPGAAKATDKGGAAALRAMVRFVRAGGMMGITPDGPRGPRMRISPGTMVLASLTRAPLYGAAFSTTRAIAFKSWDRFLLPLPFGHIYVRFAALPVNVPASQDAPGLEAARLALEDALNTMTARCDHAAGRHVVEPAPAHHNALAEPVP